MAQQLELFPISNAQVEANRLIGFSRRLIDAIDQMKTHVDHSKQLPLFRTGGYEAWQLMADRSAS
jgi:hypothetical protein